MLGAKSCLVGRTFGVFSRLRKNVAFRVVLLDLGFLAFRVVLLDLGFLAFGGDAVAFSLPLVLLLDFLGYLARTFDCCCHFMDVGAVLVVALVCAATVLACRIPPAADAHAAVLPVWHWFRWLLKSTIAVCELRLNSQITHDDCLPFRWCR